MYPIYRFTLSGGGSSVTARPQYSTLRKQIEREAGEQFYREQLDGELTFVRADYTFIMTKAFDTKFSLLIEISYDAGTTWASYWEGYFFRTDCTINEIDGIIRVKPNTEDKYDALLAGLDKEFNLIELAPVIEPILADKRPMVQVYVPGETTVACFLGNMWWEQECRAVSDVLVLDNTYKFKYVDAFGAYTCTGAVTTKVIDGGSNPYFQMEVTNSGDVFTLTRLSDGAKWRKDFTGQVVSFPTTFSHVSGTPGSGTVTVDRTVIQLCVRLVTDLANVPGLGATSPIPTNDIVPNNRNYSRCYPYNISNVLVGNDVLTATPTEWGIYQPGQYYDKPAPGIYGSDYYPVARRLWDWWSLWIPVGSIAEEQAARTQFTIRDNYPIYSVISVLLGQIAPGITHDGTTDYSEFLYDVNPITSVDQRLFLTPKSNIVNSNYDQPAQKAPITLRQVLDMLRNCFRCYWYIDTNNRLRIEHISFFHNGGSYYSTPIVGIDLTAVQNTRNGKSLATGQDTYSFDREEIAERYEFGWMDNVTQPFEGYPFLMLSNFAKPGKVEKIAAGNFTSDIDYILLNPEQVSQDGFVLLAAVYQTGNYILPYYTYYHWGANVLQNGYAAFCVLFLYYLYDLPCPSYSFDGQVAAARGQKRLKTQEKVVIPCYNDPNMLELVKTNLGNGTIRKLSLDLQSRSAEATLEYDTE